MPPALAAAVLAFLAAQAQPQDEPPAESPSPVVELPADELGPAPVEPDPLAEPLPSASLPPALPLGLADVVPRSEAQEDEDLRRSRVPFLPSAAAPARPRVGTHLVGGVLGQLRTRNLSSGGGLTQWDTDLEVVPGISLYSFGHKAQLTVSYVPRLYFPAVWHGGPLSVLHRGGVRLEWNPSKAWTLAAWGAAAYGDYSQLVPSATPGGTGAPPASLQPVRSFSTYPYVSVDVNASAAVDLRQRLRLRMTAGWFDWGGIGEVGQANQPRTWGPRADVAADVFVGARAVLTTTLAGQNAQLVGGSAIRILAAAETWSHRWSGNLETAASAGVAAVNNPPAASVTVGNFIPVAGIKATWIQSTRDLVRLTGEVALGPYVDTYLGAAYQRVTGRLGAEWFIAREWKLEGSLAAALVPFTIRAPESYAVLGASALWTPARWVSLMAGGFAQSQLDGGEGGRFLQLTGYFSLSFVTPDLP